jgi:hypothetical protein
MHALIKVLVPAKVCFLALTVAHRKFVVFEIFTRRQFEDCKI